MGETARAPGGWRTLDFEDEDDDEDDYDAVPLAIGYRLLVMRVAR
jgi:hypothetical protein